MRLGFVFFTLSLALVSFCGPAFSQRYTDPDTLAPAYPTPQAVVDRMLAIADVKPNEVVYDLGCGDGRILFTAVQKFKAKAVGIEIRREIYESTLRSITSMNLQDQIKLVHGDALKTDLSDADVVTLYLLTSSNERLKPVLKRYLRSTARVVSHDFEIRGWKPDVVEKVVVSGRPHGIYVYHVQ